MKKWVLSSILAFTAVFFAFTAQAQGVAQQPPYVTVANPLPPSQKGKIDVVEIFWYGCGHCMQLDPIVQQLEKSFPPDVAFSRAHISFNIGQENLLRLYTTLKSMGQIDKIHPLIFKHIQIERKPLATEKHVFDFVEKVGIDKKTFESTFRSLQVNAAVSQAKKVVDTAGVDFVPAFLVGGKYVTAPSWHKDLNAFVQQLDKLIEMSRAEKK